MAKVAVEESCEECGCGISGTEKAFVWDERILCFECYKTAKRGGEKTVQDELEDVVAAANAATPKAPFKASDGLSMVGILQVVLFVGAVVSILAGIVKLIEYGNSQEPNLFARYEISAMFSGAVFQLICVAVIHCLRRIAEESEKISHFLIDNGSER